MGSTVSGDNREEEEVEVRGLEASEEALPLEEDDPVHDMEAVDCAAGSTTSQGPEGSKAASSVEDPLERFSDLTEISGLKKGADGSSRGSTAGRSTILKKGAAGSSAGSDCKSREKDQLARKFKKVVSFETPPQVPETSITERTRNILKACMEIAEQRHGAGGVQWKKLFKSYQSLTENYPEDQEVTQKMFRRRMAIYREEIATKKAEDKKAEARK